MTMIKLSELNENDKIITKKNHPCGNNVWVILKKGVDFKLQCEKCRHSVVIPAETLKKSIKSVIKE